MIERVVGERAVRRRSPRLASRSTAGPDDPDLLVAEEPVFAGVGVERRDGHARLAAAGQGPHGPVGQPDLGGDGSDRIAASKTCRRATCKRDVDHAQAGPRFALR